MQTIKPSYAKLSDFRLLTPKIQYGERLKEICELQASISEFGLLHPLIVSKTGNRLIVMDGRKRLAALRRMTFDGTLPRSLVRVPYVMVGQVRQPHPDLVLLTNVEKYETVKKLAGQGFSLSEISATLHVAKDHVRDLFKVDQLSCRLKAAFLGEALSLSQVQAFASIPDKAAQDDLLMKLGPFVLENDILQAIADGETVLDLGYNNVIILPSRHRTLPDYSDVA